MKRITNSDLLRLVDRINRETRSPTAADCGSGAAVGHYYLEYAYGGVQLARITNSAGGITSPLGGGYRQQREIYEQLVAFLAGRASST